jgi:transmembrane protein EpsG
MTFYIVLSIVLILMSLLAKLSDPPSRVFINIFIFLSLVILSTIRNEVGDDFDGYRDFYFAPGWDVEMEYIYIIIARFLRFFSLPFAFFLGLMALLTIGFIWWGLRKHADFFYMSLILFVLLGMYIYSFNIVRHFVALSIIFCFGLEQIKQQNFKKYLLVVCIAGLFHASAFFCLPLYFILWRHYPAWACILFVVIAFCLNAGLGTQAIVSGLSIFLPPKYAGYLQFLPDYINALDEPFYLKILNNLDKIIICVILMVNRSRLVAINKYNIVLINFFYLNLLFSFFSRGIGPLQRIGFYFSIFSILAIPLVIYLGKNKTQKALISGGLIIAYMAFFILFFLEKNIGGGIPYKTIFN